MRARLAAVLLLVAISAPGPALARPRLVLTVPEDRLATALELGATAGTSLGRSLEVPAADLGLHGPLTPGTCGAPGLTLGVRAGPDGPVLRLRLDLAQAGALPRRVRTRCDLREDDAPRVIRVLIRRVDAPGG